jgi:hypothetical protein
MVTMITVVIHLVFCSDMEKFATVVGTTRATMRVANRLAVAAMAMSSEIDAN